MLNSAKYLGCRNVCAHSLIGIRLQDHGETSYALKRVNKRLAKNQDWENNGKPNFSNLTCTVFSFFELL